eukprot:TRINITY_DN7162_c0_g1_i1.p1 TRINITY_DN7162_c0_g1~~TRINITY_DN7162_c0_g1_i1.p1  ORF type:complete len:486 (-),score=151.87 TRINITY_DN7162_c0_g1_i1:17-1474(-)
MDSDEKKSVPEWRQKVRKRIMQRKKFQQQNLKKQHKANGNQKANFNKGTETNSSGANKMGKSAKRRLLRKKAKEQKDPLSSQDLNKDSTPKDQTPTKQNDSRKRKIDETQENEAKTKKKTSKLSHDSIQKTEKTKQSKENAPTENVDGNAAKKQAVITKTEAPVNPSKKQKKKEKAKKDEKQKMQSNDTVMKEEKIKEMSPHKALDIVAVEKQTPSKEKKPNKQEKNKNKSKSKESVQKNEVIETREKVDDEQESQLKKAPTSALQQKLQERLKGSQFRWLNEQLYTTTSVKAFETFQQDPNLFDAYHRGFRSQVEQWPLNPLDIMIEEVKKTPKKVIADFGCGEAKLAQSVKNKVHSFDLVASNEYITACDMANVPLENEAVDVAIFCLSLMGTNYGDFIREAHRVLKPSGRLLVAEVTSRIPDAEKFKSLITSVGFQPISQKSQNGFFTFFEFTKCTDTAQLIPPKLRLNASSILLPCLYKRR